MPGDRSWMYRRVANDGFGVSNEFRKGVKDFLAFAFSKPSHTSDDKIRCPCKRCKNLKYKTSEDVTLDLYLKGFVEDYTTWTSHGERFLPMPSVSTPAADVESVSSEGSSSFHDIIVDAAMPENFHQVCSHVTHADDAQREEQPNSDTLKFYGSQPSLDAEARIEAGGGPKKDSLPGFPAIVDPYKALGTLCSSSSSRCSSKSTEMSKLRVLELQLKEMQEEHMRLQNKDQKGLKGGIIPSEDVCTSDKQARRRPSEDATI